MKQVRFDPLIPADKPPQLLRKRKSSPPPDHNHVQKRQKIDPFESTDPKIIEFRKNFDFTIFQSNFDQEKTLLLNQQDQPQQFGREITKYFNETYQKSELQCYFYSDQWVESVTHEQEVFLIFQVTTRPMIRAQTTFNSLVVTHMYFSQKRLFLPIHFTLV
jgi:hypothetical protein